MPIVEKLKSIGAEIASHFDLETYLQKSDYYGHKLLDGIVVWVVGIILIKIIRVLLNVLFFKKGKQDALSPFLKSIILNGLKIALAILVLTTIGVEMTTFVALIGAAGLTFGLALSGTLQNFAGGVMIILFKPFRIGDTIEAKGYKGTVKEIQIFNTILTTPDNKQAVIPNGQLSTSSLTNFSAEETRRLDFTYGIAYGSDVKLAKETLTQIFESDDRVINDPFPPHVIVAELGASSIDLSVKVWVKAEDYFPVKAEANEKVYDKFTELGINFPFPQMDVNLYKQS